MQSRVVHSQIWTDEFFAELNSNEKLLFLYFLTTPLINILHVYKCPVRQIMFDTGIDRGIIEASMDKFDRSGKIRFYDNYVFLANAGRYQKFTGEKNEIAKRNLWNRLPDTVQVWLTGLRYTPIDTP